MLSTHTAANRATHESNVHQTNQQNKLVDQSTPTWTLSPGAFHGRTAVEGTVCLWRLRRGRRLVGRHRHGREFNPLRALLGLIMDDQSTTVCPLPSLFLGLKIAVRQGHRTPKGTMLRGAVLHCQFEREAKGGPPQRVGGSMPNTKHCPTLGFSGMSRVVLSVQFLRTKASVAFSRPWCSRRSSLVQDEQCCYNGTYHGTHRWSACSSPAVAEFDTAEWIN